MKNQIVIGVAYIHGNEISHIGVLDNELFKSDYTVSKIKKLANAVANKTYEGFDFDNRRIDLNDSDYYPSLILIDSDTVINDKKNLISQFSMMFIPKISISEDTMTKIRKSGKAYEYLNKKILLQMLKQEIVQRNEPLKDFIQGLSNVHLFTVQLDKVGA